MMRWLDYEHRSCHAPSVRWETRHPSLCRDVFQHSPCFCDARERKIHAVGRLEVIAHRLFCAIEVAVLDGEINLAMLIKQLRGVASLTREPLSGLLKHYYVAEEHRACDK